MHISKSTQLPGVREWFKKTFLVVEHYRKRGFLAVSILVYTRSNHLVSSTQLPVVREWFKKTLIVIEHVGFLVIKSL